MSIALICMSVLMLVPHCFNDCSCSVSFKIANVGPPTLFFLLRLFRLVLVPCLFIYIFMTSLPISSQSQVNFDRVYIESVDLSAEILLSKHIRAFNPWTWNVFQFIPVFTFFQQCFVGFSVKLLNFWCLFLILLFYFYYKYN